eukprot:TRINITY_DN4530_c0_g1_i1.p1 TRINITY_DN4530_c0_g1~~TRINITY_DN4530_c0_g1_i1.p1  ORF type:complete len:738 (+),score=155.67 TRINITY_DN4530_c0_g1_i1:67-2214(+)
MQRMQWDQAEQQLAGDLGRLAVSPPQQQQQMSPPVVGSVNSSSFAPPGYRPGMQRSFAPPSSPPPLAGRYDDAYCDSPPPGGANIQQGPPAPQGQSYGDRGGGYGAPQEHRGSDGYEYRGSDGYSSGYGGPRPQPGSYSGGYGCVQQRGGYAGYGDLQQRGGGYAGYGNPQPRGNFGEYGRGGYAPPPPQQDEYGYGGARQVGGGGYGRGRGGSCGRGYSDPYANGVCSGYGDQQPDCGTYGGGYGGGYRGGFQQQRPPPYAPPGVYGGSGGAAASVPPRAPRQNTYSDHGGGGGTGNWSNFRDSRRDPPEEHKEKRKAWLRKHEEDFVKNDTHADDIYQSIKIDVSGPEAPNVNLEKFRDIDLGEVLDENVLKAKYVRTMPIQKVAIPVALSGRDIMGCAQTGSGKTAAFLLPILTRILYRGPVTLPPGANDSYHWRAFPQALILAPTRELVCQIHEEALKFSAGSPLRAVCIYGGADFRPQLMELQRGVDVLVATTGRLIDAVVRGRISLTLIKYLVLDEADRMLDMGFEPDIRRIVQQMDMPTADKRQTMMFSATFPVEIQRLARDFLHQHLFLSIGRVGSTVSTIQQNLKLVSQLDKQSVVLELIKETPGLTIVFVETKRNADMLDQYLNNNGIKVSAIHGDRGQQEREMALRNFRNGEITTLVATDLAARGLDIPDVAHVINYDLPKDIDTYVHRIGANFLLFALQTPFF